MKEDLNVADNVQLQIIKFQKDKNCYENEK